MSQPNINTLRSILTFAAVVEIGTGLALVLDPALVSTLLLGAEISGVGMVLGRCFGIALLVPWDWRVGQAGSTPKALRPPFGRC